MNATDAMTLLDAGLMISAIALLTQSDFAHNYPALQPTMHALGNPSEQTLVIGGMLALVGVYLIKALFLALLAWRQTRVAFRAQAQLSERVLTVYLRQPYTFHLQHNSAQLIHNVISEVTQQTQRRHRRNRRNKRNQHNSAQLIRNVITEVGMFTFSGIHPSITLLTESLVLLALRSLLLLVEPLGALIRVSVLGLGTPEDTAMHGQQ